MFRPNNMTSRYLSIWVFPIPIDVSTSNKKSRKFSNSQKRVTSLKCPCSPFFMESFVIFTQNSASPVPDHTQTQRSGAQITLPLSTDQPGSHENSEFRRLSLSVIYGRFIGQNFFATAMIMYQIPSQSQQY